MEQKSILKAYGRSGSGNYDSFMNTYFELFEESTKKAYPEFFEKLRLKPKQKVLEVGIGTGINLLFYPKDIHLVGLDLTPQMLETARKRAVEQKRENIEFLVGDGSKIPYETNYFGAVIETFTLCAAENPQKVLEEMVRVCQPEGLIGVFDYKKANSNSMVLKDQKLLAETMRQVGIYHNGQAFGVFDPLFDLDTLIENSNLEVIDQLKIEHSFIESLGRYILKK